MTDDTPKQRQEAMLESWQARMFMATMDGEMQYTLYTAILREALRKTKPTVVPRVVGPGWISAEGVVYCNLWTKDRIYKVGHPVAFVDDFTNAWRLLADKLKLNDRDRQELFTTLRGWIARDFRNVIPLSATDKGE